MYEIEEHGTELLLWAVQQRWGPGLQPFCFTARHGGPGGVLCAFSSFSVPAFGLMACPENTLSVLEYHPHVFFVREKDFP